MPQDLALARPLARLRGLLGSVRARPASLRAAILWHQALVAAMLGASALTTVLAVERIDYLFDRARVASLQMELVIGLSAQLNRHSENVAETILLGEAELEELEAARRDARALLDRLWVLTEREMALVRSTEEREAEGGELERVARMRELFEGIDDTVGRLLLLREQGDEAGAIALFRARIEEGLSAELDAEIAAALIDEELELRALQARANSMEVRLTLLVLGMAAAAVVVSGVAGVRLARALRHPIREIVAATRAIGEGDYGARLAEDGPREIAELARQVNRSAAGLAAQRAELMERQRGLEAVIAERTGELEEANARLSRLDEMRMLFMADVSHELRTPLTVLRGEAEVALRGRAGPEEAQEALRRIVQIAAQMGRLVDDLLFLSRAEVGAIRFEMEPVALADVAEIALADARVLAERRGIRLRAVLPDAPLRVRGDAGRLAQAALVALDNAVKFAEPGSEVEVALSREGREAVLRVTNRGPDIPKADLPFVFHRFWRGRAGGAGGADGAGLGLPIARRIAEAHGGRMELESGGGRTTAVIRLPLEG